jgi:restriction system protein
MVVEALREMDGSGKAAAVKGWIADRITASGKDLPDTVLASGASKFTNDIQWARMYLVNAGILEPMEKSGRGTWKLTPKGWEIPLDQQTSQQIYNSSAKKAVSDNQVAPEDDDKQEELPGTKSWITDLVKLLPGLPDAGFERLCANIMTESGMEANVTGKSGDGGVDGEGFLPIGGFNLVRIRVAWQCKRYKDGNVPSSAIRDFRGAIAGRAEYGIFFTTSAYTPSAISEAKRFGVAPIQLVDLKALIELLGERKIGVVPKAENSSELQADANFFEEYKNPKGTANSAQLNLNICLP